MKEKKQLSIAALAAMINKANADKVQDLQKENGMLRGQVEKLNDEVWSLRDQLKKSGKKPA